jgi:hypothetical protein
MTYGYTIEKILNLFEVQNKDEAELQRFRDFLWDILDDLSGWSYDQGVDSANTCGNECCY